MALDDASDVDLSLTTPILVYFIHETSEQCNRSYSSKWNNGVYCERCRGFDRAVGLDRTLRLVASVIILWIWSMAFKAASI